MKQLLFTLVCILSLETCHLMAQERLWIPLDFQKAYHSGTRVLSGEPGKNYWQNRSDYTIKVMLKPADHLIEGEEKIHYQNNSPDSLKSIIIRLYQNIFKKGAARDFPVDPNDVHDGIKIEHMAVNGDSVPINPEAGMVRVFGTNLILNLKEPLLSGDDVMIDLTWKTLLPKISHLRMGAYPDSAFFVGHWYPQVAVYDDIDGWDRFSYTGQQEFYTDFGDFDVEVTVPSDFIVWATGTLNNIEDVLTDKYVQRYKEATMSDSIIHIIAPEDFRQNRITVDNSENTWHFTASYVPDFAFAASNTYLWDATSLLVDEQSDRRVTISAAFREDSQDFYEVAKIARDAIHFYSTNLPGVPFPYPALTVFNGSGGMEYPMMVNDGTTKTKPRTISLTSHEISHTYFPFYMGTNERKYAWMDEGWAIMLPFEFQRQLTPDYTQVDREIKGYNNFAGRFMDVPLMIPSVLLSGRSYRIQAYSRPGIAYKLLYDYLGESKFKKALHTFIDQWHGKHPIPYDFFHIFNLASGENLNWFWIPWFFDTGYPDLGIKSVNSDSNNPGIEIENLGNMPVPIKLIVTFNDSSRQIIEKPLDIWKDGNKTVCINCDHPGGIAYIKLGDRYIPDVNSDDNIFRNE